LQEIVDRHQRQRAATSSGNRQIQLSRPTRRTRRAPNDRAARFIDDRSDSVSGRFSISTTRRPAPRAKLHAGRFLRDEKASSGLALKPTDLSALLTEQIAHLRPFLIVFATPSDQRGKPTYRAFLRKLTHCTVPGLTNDPLRLARAADYHGQSLFETRLARMRP
jgi:hypothetical protein